MAETIITSFENEDEQILYGLDAWTEYLSVRDLPARASSLKRLKMLLSSDKSTVQQLASVVKKDPVLTLYVVRAAQLKHNANDAEVKSILHAVTSLGYDGIEELAAKIKPISLNPTNVQQKRFLHAIAASHHAASQLQDWMLYKNLPLIDESYLAALFYSIGFWSLWLHAPLHMQKIQTRIHEKNERPIEVENDVLGCSMQMISQNLAKHWQLSELTQMSQDHSTSPTFEILKKLHRRAVKDPNLNQQELRKLNHITQQKYFPVKLANWIALTASRSWYSEQTMRNIDLISDYLGTPPEKTLAFVHKTCAKSSRDYFAPGIMSPACQLLFLPSPIKVHYKMGAKELAANSSKYPIPEQPMILNFDLAGRESEYLEYEFYQRIENLLTANRENSKFEKAAQIIQALLQGLIKGLGVSRISLFSVNSKTSVLKSVQNLGFDSDHPIKDFQETLSPADILASICSKQSYVVYDPKTAKKLNPKISKALRNVAASEYMLISIFKVNQPVALLYLDMDDAPLSNFIRERIRHLSFCATHALEIL